MIEIFKTLMGSSDTDRKYENISPQDARDKMKELNRKEYEVIDVRTEDEFASGHLRGAINMNLFDPQFGAKTEQLDPSKAYFLICRSGNRSATACKKMAKSGHKNLYNIAGGMMSW